MVKKIAVVVMIILLITVPVSSATVDESGQFYAYPYTTLITNNAGWTTSYNAFTNNYRNDIKEGSSWFEGHVTLYPTWLLTDSNTDSDSALENRRYLTKGYTYELTMHANFRPHISTNDFIPYLCKYDPSQSRTTYVKAMNVPFDIVGGVRYSATIDQADTPGFYSVHLVFNTKYTFSENEFNLVGFMLELGNSPVKIGDRVEFNLAQAVVHYDPDGEYYESAVMGQLSEIKDSIDNGFGQNHEDLEAIEESLNRIDQDIVAGNKQAHEDAEALRETIAKQKEEEKQEAQETGNSTVDEVMDEMTIDTMPLYQAFTRLNEALTYHGYDAVWTFPEAHNIPFVGDLWDSYKIDLNEYINKKEFQPIRLVLAFIVAGCAVYSIANAIRDIYMMISGEEGEEIE